MSVKMDTSLMNISIIGNDTNNAFQEGNATNKTDYINITSIAFHIFINLESLCGLFGNILLLLVISKYKNLQPPSTLIIGSVALADFFNSLTYHYDNFSHTEISRVIFTVESRVLYQVIHEEFWIIWQHFGNVVAFCGLASCYQISCFLYKQHHH